MVLGDEARGIALVKADDMIDFVQQALKTVSYTHLDVYKRQQDE